MARVVLAGGFLWFGEVLDESFGGTQGVYYAVTNTFRTELADAMTEAANNLKALGAVINPLFTLVAIAEAGLVHVAGTALNQGNLSELSQQVLAGVGAAAQLLNPASLLLIPFVVIAMVLTVLISTMFMLASAFWPIVAGSLALPIGLGPQLFGRWLSVVVWAFLMGAIGPFVVRGGMELGVSRPAAYIASQAVEIVNTSVEQMVGQFRENRRIFAETLNDLALRNGWDPTVCGFEVFVDTDGKLNYRNVAPNPSAILSPVACGTMTKEAIAQGMRQMGTFVLGIGKGLVDMFQAWAQTLMMVAGGMAAALLIAGYLSSLVATFFGGLSLAVTAAAVGYATSVAARGVGGAGQMVQQAAGGLASAGQRAFTAGVEGVGGYILESPRTPSSWWSPPSGGMPRPCRPATSARWRCGPPGRRCRGCTGPSTARAWGPPWCGPPPGWGRAWATRVPGRSPPTREPLRPREGGPTGPRRCGPRRPPRAPPFPQGGRLRAGGLTGALTGREVMRSEALD